MTPQDQIMERARKRAKELRDFYSHLITYVAVISLLVVLDLVNQSAGAETFIGLEWAYWPAFGWGLFVALHAAGTFFGAASWEDRKAHELYEREKQREFVDH